MAPFTFSAFGNPSSVHTYGATTRTAVDKARQQVAALINCWADELAFTSCGTEADNWAIWGTVMARRDAVQGLPHVVTSAVEHPAVTKCLQQLQQLVSWMDLWAFCGRRSCCFVPSAGMQDACTAHADALCWPALLSAASPLLLPQGLCEYTAVGVDAAGLVSPADVVAALTPNTVLVSVMHSNNEVGAIQPIGAITAAVKGVRPDVLVHTDAAQSMGRLDVDVQVCWLGKTLGCWCFGEGGDDPWRWAMFGCQSLVPLCILSNSLSLWMSGTC
jgi:cysteine desulfurase